VIRETLAVGLLGCNCTVLGDEQSREAIVVDPGYEIPKIVAVLAKHQLTVKKIVVTHAHIDHIASAQTLKELTGAPILYSKDDIPQLAIMGVQASWFNLAVPTVLPPDHSPDEGEWVSVRGVDAMVMHTPGHTEGSVCLYLPDAALLLAGDTLFAGGVGRTDFPGGNEDKLIASIRERLFALPDATVVVPGHGPETTIGVERVENPFLG
jgi:glyoxylase-like metal-dependent hydrolase (beta-lactamase superfamily II)